MTLAAFNSHGEAEALKLRLVAAGISAAIQSESKPEAHAEYSRLSAGVQVQVSRADFETALKRLEEIVKKLESGDLSLDSALELFEEGIKLSRFCHTRLEQAERKVEILLKNNSGQPRAVPFESENEQ